MGGKTPDPMGSEFPRASDGTEDAVPAEGRVSPFRFLNPDTLINEKNITAVLVIPFTETLDRIIAVNHLKRGIDIPGGHVEEDDKSFYDTARRELFEETGAQIGHVIPIMIMESDHYGDDQQDGPSYMVVLTGIVDNTNLGTFEPTKQISSRHFVDPEEFLENYDGDYLEDMRVIISHALATVSHHQGIAPHVPEQE